MFLDKLQQSDRLQFMTMDAFLVRRQAATAERGLQRGVGSGQTGSGVVPGRYGHRAPRGN